MTTLADAINKTDATKGQAGQPFALPPDGEPGNSDAARWKQLAESWERMYRSAECLLAQRDKDHQRELTRTRRLFEDAMFRLAEAKAERDRLGDLLLSANETIETHQKQLVRLSA